jgi:hypothetical protein
MGSPSAFLMNQESQDPRFFQETLRFKSRILRLWLILIAFLIMNVSMKHQRQRQVHRNHQSRRGNFINIYHGGPRSTLV